MLGSAACFLKVLHKGSTGFLNLLQFNFHCMGSLIDLFEAIHKHSIGIVMVVLSELEDVLKVFDIIIKGIAHGRIIDKPGWLSTGNECLDKSH